MASCSQLTDLPALMLIEILTRLPVESLLRCKCVCKNWCDLIRNPSFARDHFRLQKLQDKARIFFQYFKFTDDGGGKFFYALFPDETLASDACRKLGSLENTLNSPSVYGPANGLFCVFVGDDRFSFIIWNPATRDVRTLPSVGQPEPEPNLDIVFPNFAVSKVGFGFDESNACFKVVLIRNFIHRVKGMPAGVDVCVHVYSQSTNTWKHLNSLDCLLPEYWRQLRGIGAYLNGVYYWWAGTGIVAFDMGSEVFRVISAPPILPQEFECDVKVYNGDSIALYQFKGFPMAESFLDKYCDICVMEEEGCWIKQFQVGPIPFDLQHGFWKSRELLFSKLLPSSYGFYDDPLYQLVLYDPYTQKLRYLGPKNESIGYQALVYHESLVSINGGIDQTIDTNDSSGVLLQLEPHNLHFDPRPYI